MDRGGSLVERRIRDQEVAGSILNRAVTLQSWANCFIHICPGQLSLSSLLGRQMSTNFGWGRNGKFCDAVGPVSRTAGYASLNGFTILAGSKCHRDELLAYGLWAMRILLLLL